MAALTRADVEHVAHLARLGLTEDELARLETQLNHILDAIEKDQAEKQKPSMIVAHTIKGKVVPFTENDNSWHKRVPTKDELAAALAHLGY